MWSYLISPGSDNIAVTLHILSVHNHAYGNLLWVQFCAVDNQMQAMAWCTDVVAVYLPHIGHAHFKKIVRQLLFLEEAEVI